MFGRNLALVVIIVVVDTITDLMHTSSKMPHLLFKLMKERVKRMDVVDSKG